MPLRNILEAEFRANPAYDLVLFDRLPPDQQAALSDLKKDPDFYGMLMPREGAGLAIKSICRDTALLYLTLAQPGPVPSYLRQAPGQKCNQAVAELVLDGVLEIGRDGGFASGSEAYTAIYTGESASGEPGGRLARLARAALRYAQALEIDDSARLSARLYFYNRIPLSSRWTRRFPSEEAVAAYLGLGENRRLIERRWSRMQLAPPNNGWFQWHSRESSAGNGGHGGYKLYVSPRPEHVREAFDVVIELLKDAPARYFKVGNDAAGLLRPDKLVLYFSTFEALEQAARQLQSRLSGCPAHGVPFSAEITEDGLLSWGSDPPPDKGALAWRERESWRLWITNRLATAMLSAKKAGAGEIEPWQFALQRLQLDNVDTTTWVPMPAFGRLAEDQ